MIRLKIRWQCFACVFLLAIGAAKAQTPLSLDECLRMALENNRQIKIASNEVRKTDRQISETRAALLPQISGEYNFTYSPDLPPVFLPGFIVGQPQVENVPAVLGLRQTQFAGIQASQQLFNPQLFIALKAVKAVNQLTELQLIEVKEEIVYNVSATYYNLLTLYKQMDLLQSNIKSFETTIRTTETLQRNDLAKKSDVNRLILAKKSLETQLINLKVAESTLLNVLRLLTNTAPESPLAIDTDISSEKVSIETSLTTAQSRNMLKILQAFEELKNIERKSIAAAYMPTLVLFGGYFSYAYNADFAPFERAENKSFTVSQIGISLRVPIFDGGAKRAKMQQKSFEIQNTQQQQQLLMQQIGNDIQDAAQKYNASVEVLQNEEENIALAERTLVEIKTNYRNGFASITDIIEAENDLQKTQTQYLAALVNLRLAVLEWKKANGTLLNF